MALLVPQEAGILSFKMYSVEWMSNSASCKILPTSNGGESCCEVRSHTACIIGLLCTSMRSIKVFDGEITQWFKITHEISRALQVQEKRKHNKLVNNAMNNDYLNLKAISL